MTLKGGEIFLRTATGGFTPADIQACAMYNGVYATICNNSISPGNPGHLGERGRGGSAVSTRARDHCQGRVGCRAAGGCTIPIGAYRARHRIPEISWPLYAPVYAKYVNNFPPSLFTKHLPPTLPDAARFLRDPKTGTGNDRLANRGEVRR